MATYLNDLRLTELATGEGSGTWGTTTNLSLELIGEALGFATQQVFGSDADATTTIADGASDPARAMYFKITSAGSLTATRTCTIAPNTISRVMFIENATTGSQSIAISQGSGASVTILAGKTAVVYLDGAGATAAVVDAMSGVDPGVTDTLTEVLVAGNTSGGTNIELSTTDKVQFRDADIYLNSSVDGQLDIVADTEIQIAATTIDVNGTLAFDSLKGTGATTVTNILDEDNMASDSATAIATQQSIKAYVDSQVGTVDTLSEILANGNTTGSTDIAVDSAQKVQFRDAAIYINSSVDGQLDIVADTEIQIAATTIDINGAINASGEIIAASLDISGDIDVDGTTNLDVVDIDGTLNVAGVSTFTAAINQTTESPSINLTDSSSSRTLSVNVDDNNSFLRASGPMLLQTGGAITAITINASQNSTFAGTVTATGTSVFASLDISGDIDVDGTTNLDVVDIDGAVDMASTLQVTGAANFSDRIGSKYVYPTDATSQTSTVTNHFWKMGRMTLSGPAAAEIELHGLTGYGQGDPIAGKNIIQLRGSNSATVLDGTFHATGDPGIGIQEMRYVPIGSYVFDLYVKLGPFTSLSTTVTCGGTWAPEWTDTGSGSNPASSVDMPAHYALLLGNNNAMYADLSEVVFNDDSNDIDFRVESDDNANMLFVDGGNNRVGIGKAPASQPFEVGVYAQFDTGMTINESGADSDFRVESDTNANALFVDGSKLSPRQYNCRQH
jgi:cytoskeletal protein CcmA (bactofilin family)